MRIGFVYCLGAFACLLVFVSTSSALVRFVSIWIGLGCATFSFGYLSQHGEILMKSSAGRKPWFSKVLLSPILLFISIYNLWARGRDSNPPIQEVGKGLYLGRRLFPTDAALLKEKGITAILDVTVEFDAVSSLLLEGAIDYCNIPVFDHSVPRKGQLQKALRWIHRHRMGGGKVLIHCALGQGRSAMVLLAYLLFTERDQSLARLVERLRLIRDSVQPNRHQMALLLRFRQDMELEHGLKAALIFNPVAGNGDNSVELMRVREALEPYFQLSVYETEAGVPARDLARRALKEGAGLLIACGGDGTVAAAASVLIDSDVPLGIIPTGSANALSSALHGPFQADRIFWHCECIIEGVTQRIDIGICNGQPMVLLAGVGLEAGMVAHADRELKQRWGALAYLASALDQLGDLPLFTARLEVDGEVHECETGSIVVANVAPSSSLLAQGGGPPDLADGNLDVTTITGAMGAAAAVHTMAALFCRGLFDDTNRSLNPLEGGVGDSILHLKGRVIRLVTNPPQRVVVDGEMMGMTPVAFSVKPKALSVFVREQKRQDRGPPLS